MNLNKIGLFVLFCLWSIHIHAQTSELNNRLLPASTSANGNFLHLFVRTDTSTNAAQQDIAYYVVKRIPFTIQNLVSKESSAKIVGVVKPVQTVSELKQYFTFEDIKILKAAYQLKTESDIVKYFNQHRQPEDYLAFYGSLNTQLALGHVFVDKDAQKGVAYTYFIKAVTSNKTERLVGYSFIETNAPNYYLPHLKPTNTSIFTHDSAVQVSWAVPIPKTVQDGLAVPAASNASDSLKLTRWVFFQPEKLMGRLFVKTGNNFKAEQSRMPQMNATADTLFYDFYMPATPEQVVIAYVQMEDEVGNQGLQSDTVVALALSKTNLPIVHSASATSVENGIQLRWNAIMSKHYVSGVKIMRYDSQDKLDTIAVMHPTDTSFIDYKVQVGQTYRYKISTLFIPQLRMQQELPAEAVGTLSKFATLQPVVNLTATPFSKHILLKWDWKSAPGFYGFYVYRGSSPNQLKLIDGPIQSASYIDSAISLSGKNDYYYAVKVQNLAQVMSVQSNVVKSSPNRPVEVASPTNLRFYYANGTVIIGWDDVAKQDATIERFVVWKKQKTEKIFRLLGSSPINSLIDSSIEAGIDYEYQVAAVNFKKDTSVYSAPFVFTVAKQPVEVLSVFYVRNIAEGIELSLPQMVVSDRKMYTIYRRESGNSVFSKLASLKADTFVYVDKAVKANTTYVYAIAIVMNDNREGDRSHSVSIRKN